MLQGLSDWWIETVAREIDANPIFSGLTPRARRNPRKRAAYLAERAASPSPSHLRTGIYTSDYILGCRQNDALELDVLRRAVKADMAGGGKAADWSAIVTELVTEPGIPFYFPALTAHPAVLFDDIRNAELARIDKAASEARAKEARRIAADMARAEEKLKYQAQREAARQQTLVKIATLENELKRLNILFLNTTEFMDQARLMIAIESREDAVKQLRSRL